MSGESPKCRVIVAHRFYKFGDIIAPGAMLRNDLLRRGWIELLPEKVAVVELESTNGSQEAIDDMTETKELPKRKRRKKDTE